MKLGHASAKWVWVAAALTVAGCSSAGSGAALGTLPGAEAYPKMLQQQLASALSAQGTEYVPRTHHLNEDGSPKYVNRLMLESSPYLRQHAHNPVNWYPWGDEAFETAKRLKRPVLLSIGYSTCHWCHVMEEESFEDAEIAAYLNANYVAIKVDREERPDLDAIYMAAVYALHGRGGWPMTTWLTPDREPFYGGTYFPPRDGMRRNRRGFLPLLAELKQLFDSSPDEVAGGIQKARQSIKNRMSPVPGSNVPGERELDAAVRAYRDRFDQVNGGAKRAPKFPSNFPVRLLYRYHRRSGQDEWREMATFTLDKMARGGIHDQVGGGFHRYSTDSRWLVPHFEKMLYDNAQLTVAYLDGFQVTGRADFAEVARKTLRYVSREMTSDDGAFFSATDADSPTPDGRREEGWFFVWTPDEIRAVLGDEDAGPFEAYYGVTARGNFEHRNILNVPRAPEEVAGQLGLPLADLEQRLALAREKLYEARLKKPGPLRDEKILTSWNGLMISAMARGGFVLDEPEFVERAAKAADFLLKKSRKKGRLFRSYMDGRAQHNAYLDDYAFLIAGLLDLYEATSGIRWLREAIALQKTLDEQYLDEKTGGYFLTSHDHEQLLARERPGRDKAEPSGNSVAAMNLLRLHELTLDDRYLNASEQLLGAFARNVRGSPVMMMAVDFLLGRPKEVVIVSAGGREAAGPLLEVLRETYLPNKVVAVVSEGRDLEALGELIPMVRGKVARQGRPTAYVCEQGLCELPTGDPAMLVKQLSGGGTASNPISPLEQ